MHNRIVDIIVDHANEVNGRLRDKIVVDLKEKAPLFGDNGVLDSIALFTLIVEIERSLEHEFDVPVLLVDERALTQKNNPYETIGSLANYATSVIN